MLTKSVADVLASKEARDIVSTKPNATVKEAAALMSSKGVGAIAIRTGGGPLEGIFTERDLLRRVVAAGLDPGATPVSKVMTPEVRSISARSTVEDALRLMALHGYRHLVVQDGSVVAGMISARDLMSFLVRPDQPIADEGRVGVERARLRDAVEAVRGAKS